MRSEPAKVKAAGKYIHAKAAGKTPGPGEYLKQTKAAVADLKATHPGKDGKWYIQEAQKARVTESEESRGRKKGKKAKVEAAKLEPAMEDEAEEMCKAEEAERMCKAEEDGEAEAEEAEGMCKAEDGEDVHAWPWLEEEADVE